jgi:hypothetical protein
MMQASSQNRLDWLEDVIIAPTNIEKPDAPKDVAIEDETHSYVNMSAISLEGFSSLYDEIENVLPSVPTRPLPPVPQGTPINYDQKHELSDR